MIKILNFMLWLLLWLWQLPQNLVGLILLPFLHKVLYRKYKHERIYISTSIRGGISLGNYVIIRRPNEEIITHERGHCKQSRILGWFYLIVIGLPSLLHAALCSCSGQRYYYFYTERWANSLMGIKIKEDECKD